MINFRWRERWPNYLVQWALSGVHPSMVGMKAKACVRYDRRCVEIQRDREAVK